MVFWTTLTPEKRAQVIEALRKTGARAIVSLSKPDAAEAPGWQNVRGTEAWIYHF